MTLGDLENKIKEIKDNLKEEFNWTEEGLQEVEVYVNVQDEEGGISAVLKDVEIDAPPLTFFLVGQLANPKYRISLEDVNED